jgi:hypothetical protein
MYIFMNVPLMVATATSNFMIGVTAAASAIVYYRRGDILVEIAAPLAVGVFMGSLLGARLAPRIQTKYVVYLAGGDHALSRRSYDRAPAHGRRGMSQVREPGFDRVVALVLRVGAFGCFFIMLAGLLVGLFVPGRLPGIERAGVLLMLATPVVRCWLPAFFFCAKKTGSTVRSRLECSTILLLSAVFGIGEH